MEIIFLGTSSMVPTKERNHPSFYLKYDKEGLLFDCLFLFNMEEYFEINDPVVEIAFNFSLSYQVHNIIVICHVIPPYIKY